MRVVGEQRAARRALRAGDDPVVRANLVVAGDTVGTIETRQRQDLAAESGDVAPCARFIGVDRGRG